MDSLELINSLISGKILVNNIEYSLPYNELSGLNYDTDGSFYKLLSTFMTNEYTILNKFDHTGIRTSDYWTNSSGNIVNSLGHEIDDKADLDDSYLDNLISKLDSSSKNQHWNESLNYWINYYKNRINIDSLVDKEGSITYNEDGEVISTNGSINGGVEDFTFRIKDIIEADAGNSFISEKLMDIDNPWVIPWVNIDRETYSKVRGIDKIDSVLESMKELNFTQSPVGSDKTAEEYKTEDKEKYSKYLRLIMPKYLRRVEIEDLDRNFWVIGQTLSALSAYLFNDNPIFPYLLGLLDEICQIWENVLYLWAAAGELGSKVYTDVKTLFIPVQARQIQCYINFDNIEGNNITDTEKDVKESATNMLEASWSKLKYIKDTYKDSNLVIIPEIRDKTYKENWYSKVFYPGVIEYDRNKNEVSYLPFAHENIQSEGKDSIRRYAPFKIDLTDSHEYLLYRTSNKINYELIDNATGIKETDNSYYVSKSLVKEQTELLADGYYYADIRTVLTLEDTTKGHYPTYDTNKKEIVWDSMMELSFRDAHRLSISGEKDIQAELEQWRMLKKDGVIQLWIARWVDYSKLDKPKEIKKIGQTYYTDDKGRHDVDRDDERVKDINELVDNFTGFYRGELLSYPFKIDYLNWDNAEQKNILVKSIMSIKSIIDDINDNGLTNSNFFTNTQKEYASGAYSYNVGGEEIYNYNKLIEYYESELKKICEGNPNNATAYVIIPRYSQAKNDEEKSSISECIPFLTFMRYDYGNKKCVTLHYQIQMDESNSYNMGYSQSYKVPYVSSCWESTNTIGPNSASTSRFGRAYSKPVTDTTKYEVLYLPKFYKEKDGTATYGTLRVGPLSIENDGNNGIKLGDFILPCIDCGYQFYGAGGPVSCSWYTSYYYLCTFNSKTKKIIAQWIDNNSIIDKKSYSFTSDTTPDYANFDPINKNKYYKEYLRSIGSDK